MAMKIDQRTRIIILSIMFIGIVSYNAFFSVTPVTRQFNAKRSYADVITQVGYGPRTPGSQGHALTRQYIMDQLAYAGWQVTQEEFTAPITGVTGYNLVASRRYGGKKIILGAHYDTRLFADNETDPNKKSQAGLGANDGASGVAILLEIGRTLDPKIENVDLVFFDLEDQGEIGNWDWTLGSQAFVDTMEEDPAAMVLVDMVGNQNAHFSYEVTSDQTIREQIWKVASERGHGAYFPTENGFSILDDHTPFLKKNIPAVDIIDITDPTWHTLGDVPEHVSKDTLFAVGDTLVGWLETFNECILKENCEPYG